MPKLMASFDYFQPFVTGTFGRSGETVVEKHLDSRFLRVIVVNPFWDESYKTTCSCSSTERNVDSASEID